MVTSFSAISQHDDVIQCDTVSLWLIRFFVTNDYKKYKKAQTKTKNPPPKVPTVLLKKERIHRKSMQPTSYALW